MTKTRLLFILRGLVPRNFIWKIVEGGQETISASALVGGGRGYFWHPAGGVKFSTRKTQNIRPKDVNSAVIIMHVIRAII